MFVSISKLPDGDLDMRICLFGGPGIGKSTLAYRLTAALKEMHMSVAFVDEWIKAWAYEKRIPRGWDQFHVFGQQLYKEAHVLQHGVNHIVTDSPILMQCAYMKRDNAKYADECLATALKFEEDYPSLNIRLLRGGFGYESQGRYESFDQAVAVDQMIKTVMDDNLRDYLEYRAVDHEALLKDLIPRITCCHTVNRNPVV